MFDKVEIRVWSGDGGGGAVSFRHEAHVPFGGPDGGDGGRGGDAVVIADPSLTSLHTFRAGRLYQAGKGGNGKGRKMHGKNGEQLTLRVPVGTLVWDVSQPGRRVLVADCEQPGCRVIVARGGRGGWGNSHFASPTNQAPRIAQKGEAGDELTLVLEMRQIADIGLIGLPNAGKSTLLAAASAAQPKIADYPFTTLEPVLGAIEVGQRTFVVAEIPGLIEGAHLGKGLGYEFLRHAMRTRLLIHLIDGDAVSPVGDMRLVNTELSLYDEALAQKPQLVVVNKIDLPAVKARLGDIEAAFKAAGTPVLFISAATQVGVAELISEAMRMLSRLDAEVATKAPKTIFRPQPREGASVRREGDIFMVTAPELERIVARVDVGDSEVQRQLRKQLGHLGINRALKRAGAKPGDRVRCGSYELEW